MDEIGGRTRKEKVYRAMVPAMLEHELQGDIGCSTLAVCVSASSPAAGQVPDINHLVLRARGQAVWG